VKPDLVKRGNRPTWKTSTAARALEAHRLKSDGDNVGTDPALAALYQKFDVAYDALRALPELEQRRAAARELAPRITEIDAAMRRIGMANGHDPELAHLRADKAFLLTLRGFEQCCGWSQAETWEQLDVRE
jgi:hypothetical protein